MGLMRRRGLLAEASGGGEGVSVEWIPGKHVNSSGNVNSSFISKNESTGCTPFEVAPGQTVTLTNTDPDWVAPWAYIAFYKNDASHSMIYPRHEGVNVHSYSWTAPSNAVLCRCSIWMRMDDSLDTMRIYLS